MGYYLYLHTNGELIVKNKAVVDSIGPGDYFDSPFVKVWFYIDTRDSLIGALHQCKLMGVKSEAIKRIESANDIRPEEYPQ